MSMKRLERWLVGLARNRQQGMALLVLLMLVLMMSALGTGFIMTTTMGKRLAQAERDSILASYMAESGVAWALSRMRYGRWLMDVDYNNDNAYTSLGDCTSPGDHLGHFIHDFVSYPSIYPPAAYPTAAARPDFVWDRRYNDYVDADPCGLVPEFEEPTGFTVWAEQPSPYINLWRLISVGYANNLSRNLEVQFRTRPALGNFAISADKAIELGTFRDSLTPFYGVVRGSVWSNGEIRIDLGVLIELYPNGADGYSGRNPATGLNDDQYVACLGHLSCGGLIRPVPGSSGTLQVYASSADTYLLDVVGSGNAARRIGLGGPVNPPRGRVQGTMNLRDGYEITGWNNFSDMPIWDYALVWDGRDPVLHDKTFQNCFAKRAPVFDGSTDCRSYWLNPVWGDAPVFHPSRLTPSPTPVNSPTPTPTPVGTPPTPTSAPPNPIDVPDENMCNGVSSTTSLRFTDSAISECPEFWGQWQGDNPESWAEYCAKSEDYVGRSDVICPFAVDSPYNERLDPWDWSFSDVNTDYAGGYPHQQSAYLQNHPGDEDSTLLLKKDFGFTRFDFEVGGENYFTEIARSSPESQRPGEGTLFNTWLDFTMYINDDSNDLVWHEGDHPYGAGTIVIGDQTEGSLFYIKEGFNTPPDGTHGFVSTPKNLIVFGGIMCPGTIDIRDYGLHARLVPDFKKIYDWWPGRASGDPPPAGYIYMPDGVRSLIIVQPNPALPALAAGVDIKIIGKKYPVIIMGGNDPTDSDPDEGALVYAKRRIYVDNPNFDPTTYLFTVFGGVHAQYVNLYRSFNIQYRSTISEVEFVIDQRPEDLEIISIHKSKKLDERAYYTPGGP